MARLIRPGRARPLSLDNDQVGAASGARSIAGGCARPNGAAGARSPETPVAMSWAIVASSTAAVPPRSHAMSDDVPQELETIDPNNPPEGYTGPTPLETIDPNNPPEGYTGPTPLQTIDPYNPPDGYTGPTP